MKKLPIAVDVCPMRYAEMDVRDDKSRHCDHCTRPVHDLSARTHEEARRFLERNRGNACVRYLYDARGRVHHARRPVESPRRTARIGALLVGASAMLLEACGGARPVLQDWQSIPSQSVDERSGDSSEGRGAEEGAEDVPRRDEPSATPSAEDDQAEAGVR